MTEPIHYHLPENLTEAHSLLARPKAVIVAGGTDFYPSRTAADHTQNILDITRIKELCGISQIGNVWRIGAATKWSEIAAADLPTAFRGLQQAAREVGSIQIQNAGTIGGNLCNASPAADGMPPLISLDAKVEIGSLLGIRIVPLAEFVSGVRSTVLKPGELVTAVLIDSPPENAVGQFEKLGARKYLVISITMVSAIIRTDAQGRIDFARVAIGACSQVAQRLTGLEEDLIGAAPTDVSVTARHLEALSPIDDVRGTASFRLEAVAEQCIRAIETAGTFNE